MKVKQNTMTFVLDDIVNDKRFQRLFLVEHQCALQLWVLRVEGDDFVETKIIYGRLLPYSFSNNSWSFSDSDNSKMFEGYKAQVKKLSIYLDGLAAKRVIEKLCSGENLRNINNICGLRFGQSKIDELFGDTRLSYHELAFKPLSYLINKDAHPRSSIGSPHGNAGALSASIIQCNKHELLAAQGNYDVDLTSMLIEQLNQETGLSFDKHDLSRFGDIELMVFPSIDEKERSLKNIQWADNKKEIHVNINPIGLHQYSIFQFNLRIENSGQILYSSLKTANQGDNGNYECTFNIDAKFHSIADSLSLDIYGAIDEETDEFILCDRWTTHFIREMNFQLNTISNSSEFNKFDWLEKTVNPKMSDRVAKVLSLKSSNSITSNKLTTRKSDPWVSINESLSKTFRLIYPEKSDGAFFPRWGMSSGEGRLQFTEWFKELAQSNQGHSITVFDPYFEDAGLALILLSSAVNSDYTIFRTNHQTEGAITTKGLETLLQTCIHNQKLMQQRTVNIYGISDGSLHDRYILVTDANGIPVKGYHLSNSFQSAAENHPLLITPIPRDVLYKIIEYKNSLLSNSTEKVTHLYDSKKLESVTLNKDDTFFESDVMGDVLSYWLNQPILKGLKGNILINKLKALDLYHDDFPHGIDPNGLKLFIDAIDFSTVDFNYYWGAIGEILSRTVTKCHDADYFVGKPSFLDALISILKETFDRDGDDVIKRELSLVSPSYFKQTLSDLLYSSTTPSNFSLGIKQSLLTWGEYFCIQYLWMCNPNELIKVVDAQVKKLNNEFNGLDSIRLSVLGQVLREISLTIEFRQTSDLQIAALLESNHDFFKWLAWYELGYRVSSSNNVDIVSKLPINKQCIFIGWLINRYSKAERDENLFNRLIDELHQRLPHKLELSLLRNTIDSMRGHMKELSWVEPWISRKVTVPLIESNRVTFDDASQIWNEELIGLLEPINLRNSGLFNVSREGEVTNITAWLWSQSSPSHQNKCLKKFDRILRKQKQVIQQPLASTTNWSNWDDSLKISLWVWLFAEWCRYYNLTIGRNNSQKLMELYRKAKELALVRPESEWLQSEIFLQIKWVSEQR
ncbi:conserved hypothetical protein (plasmid) [Aliivibrio fischeri MJ11]|uniref:Uncharacterized protein n=1 Tax=Aliivibrio fischeri (strain MJ11) TaxID=388396 RepID=B5EW00_ALIFM|nr:VPA1262 family protein [Aliivibrio fischeri]ACH64742.1 conserved hypothetical protein [Aliivibrio fischeri MJ11]